MSTARISVIWCVSNQQTPCDIRSLGTRTSRWARLRVLVLRFGLQYGSFYKFHPFWEQCFRPTPIYTRTAIWSWKRTLGSRCDATLLKSPGSLPKLTDSWKKPRTSAHIPDIIKPPTGPHLNVVALQMRPASPRVHSQMPAVAV